MRSKEAIWEELQAAQNELQYLDKYVQDRAAEGECASGPGSGGRGAVYTDEEEQAQRALVALVKRLEEELKSMRS